MSSLGCHECLQKKSGHSAVWPAIGNACLVLNILIENVLYFIQDFSRSVLGKISNRTKNSATFNSYCFVIKDNMAGDK